MSQRHVVKKKERTLPLPVWKKQEIHFRWHGFILSRVLATSTTVFVFACWVLDQRLETWKKTAGFILYRFDQPIGTSSDKTSSIFSFCVWKIQLSSKFMTGILFYPLPKNSSEPVTTQWQHCSGMRVVYALFCWYQWMFTAYVRCQQRNVSIKNAKFRFDTLLVHT